MDKIVEKNVQTIQSIAKKKKIKSAIKQTVIGVVLSSIALSTVPNLKYNIALFNAKSDSYIASVLNSDDNKIEQVKMIYAKAINNNPNLDDKLKKKMIESFSKYVLDKFAVFFSEENIRNMYAVASTETISEMSAFAKAYGWWSGDYNSYFNNLSLNTLDNEELLAHEQLHAMVKSGLFGTGLTDGINAYGANEGVTSLMCNDNSYIKQQGIMDQLGLLMGYNKVIPYYLDGNISGLKEELCKYISEDDANKLISDLDTLTFSDYFLEWVWNNKEFSHFGDICEKIVVNKNNTYASLLSQLEEICVAKVNGNPKCAYLYDNLYGERRRCFYNTNLTDILSENMDASLYEINCHDEQNVCIRLIQRDWCTNPFVEEYVIPYDELGNFDISSKLQQFEKKNNEIFEATNNKFK